MAHEIQDKEISDEEYDENADEDFNPEQAGQDEEASSSDEEQETAATTKPAKGRKKRKGGADAENDDLDSGDEATIQERKKKRRKATAPEDEDSGGEGGLIKTRAQRLAEKIEKKQRKRGVQGEVTVDVDALWADLKNVAVGRDSYMPPKAADDGEEDGEGEGRPDGNGDELITIKRRIEYAGEITEVEDRVPRSSKEAQRYLREHPEADPSHPNHGHPSSNFDKENTPTLNRPLRRPSLFEPNPTATIKNVPPSSLRPRAPNRLDVLMAEKRAEEERKKKAEKMSTVQKSALDWRGWVDRQEGLREELDVYGRSKSGFLAREEFLGRAEWAREARGREARMKG